MEQYYRLFSSYRIPGIDKDKLVESHTNLALEPEHVIVISRNQVINCYLSFLKAIKWFFFHKRFLC